jgi:hypothetical protein
MAAQASVVVSDVCGAVTQVGAESGVVVPLQAPVEEWVGAVRRQLERKLVPPLYVHSWRDVAQEYEVIYLRCKK